MRRPDEALRSDLEPAAHRPVPADDAAGVRRKRSAGKATWPGRKQVFREYGTDGRILADTIGHQDEALPGRPLLQPVMRRGRCLAPPSLERSRALAAREIATLPERCRGMSRPQPIEPAISAGLRAAAERVDREFP